MYIDYNLVKGLEGYPESEIQDGNYLNIFTFNSRDFLIMKIKNIWSVEEKIWRADPSLTTL